MIVVTSTDFCVDLLMTLKYSVSLYFRQTLKEPCAREVKGQQTSFESRRF